MSNDITPTPSRPSGARRAPGSPGSAANIPGGVPAVVAVVVLLVAAAAVWFLLGGDGEGDARADECFVETIRLTTATELRPVVDRGVAALSDDDPCLDIEVTDGAVKDVIALLDDPNATLPDLWIPDSPTWQGQLTAAGYRGTEITSSVAESPVGLASGPAIDAPDSWIETLRNGRLAVSDPSADGASALALLAPYAERRRTGVEPLEIVGATVPVAQAYGEQVARKSTVSDPAAVTATSTQLIPMTEREYLMARRSNSDLTMAAPDTGAPVLRYPLISVTRANLDPLSKSGEGKGARAGRALAHWFASEQGRAAVTQSEFRLPGATSLGAADTPLTGTTNLRTVRQQTTDSVLRTWRVLAVPSSMLVLVDVSGSMKFDGGEGRSRIELTASAAETALDQLPEAARIGLWAFSIDQGGPGQDWRRLAPLRPLDAESGGTTHKEALRSKLPQVIAMPRGGTGLYDSVLAGYKEALDSYDGSYFNSLVVMTDGANEDPGSISESELLSSIEQMRDPSRPVRIIPIGIGQEADMAALRKIAVATGSQAYQAENPNEILLVLRSALLAR
jgi:Mg-chelatase subunit ChlD